MVRDILHCDLNSFYASVEILLNPQLKGKPVAVCGNAEERRGIILARSQQAKRCGVKAGEAIWQAKNKCPELITVLPRFDRYMEFSQAARAIYEDYTDLIEPFGIDECWLDVTGSTRLFGSPIHIANEIRERMKREVGLTISVGVSFNKVFAKLGSDMKKPDAVTVIPESSFREKIWGLPACDMLGVGKATNKKLLRYGITTIGELANAPSELLKLTFGVGGAVLKNYANGLDNSRVTESGYCAPIKSVGHGITCTQDLHTHEEVWHIFYELSRAISDKLRDNGLYAGGIQIAVRDKNLNIRQYQAKLETYTQSVKAIAHKADNIFSENHDFAFGIRSLTVRAINLVQKNTPIQLSLDCDIMQEEKNEKIELAMKKIRGRFGNDSIKFACLTENLHIPR